MSANILLAGEEPGLPAIRCWGFSTIGKTTDVLLIKQRERLLEECQEEGGKTKMYPIFQAGHRVRIVSYGPFRGLIGTIQNVDAIIDLVEPFCFYQIELEGAFTKEPVWFEYDEVEPVSPYECEFHLSLMKFTAPS